MRKLTETLARLGAARLAELLGKPTVDLLEVLDLRGLTASNLAQLLIAQQGSEGLLLNASLRHELFDAMARDDAERLVRLLGRENRGNPWDSLARVRFSRGLEATSILFGFFNCLLPDDSRQELPPSTERVAPYYPLFRHQIRANAQVLEYLRSRRPRVMLHMPTGSGKTRTAMNVLAHLMRAPEAEGKAIVWLAHSEELCEQAAQEFVQSWEYLGNRSLTVFRAFGPHNIDLDIVRDGLLVASIQLAYSRSLKQQGAFLRLAQRARYVVMDEAHQAIAPTYQHVLDLLAQDPGTGVLGLSATPGRSLLDVEQDLRLAEFFFRQKVTLEVPGYANPVRYLQDEGYLATVDYESVPYAPGEDFQLDASEIQRLRQGFDLSDEAVARLGADHKRNFLILSRLMEEADAGNLVLVFACSVEHARLLASVLKMKGYGAGSITSETPPAHRRRMISEFRRGEGIRILTNYGVLTTGFDAPKTDVAVITRPTRSVVLYSQMVGRAARGPKAGGTKECRIITVVDQLPGFRSVAEAFTFWEDIWES